MPGGLETRPFRSPGRQYDFGAMPLPPGGPPGRHTAVSVLRGTGPRSGGSTSLFEPHTPPSHNPLYHLRRQRGRYSICLVNDQPGCADGPRPRPPSGRWANAVGDPDNIEVWKHGTPDYCCSRRRIHGSLIERIQESVDRKQYYRGRLLFVMD